MGSPPYRVLERRPPPPLFRLGRLFRRCYSILRRLPSRYGILVPIFATRFLLSNPPKHRLLFNLLFRSFVCFMRPIRRHPTPRSPRSCSDLHGQSELGSNFQLPLLFTGLQPLVAPLRRHPPRQRPSTSRPPRTGRTEHCSRRTFPLPILDCALPCTRSQYLSFSTPSMDAGGCRKMIPRPTIRPRQPRREPWSMDRLRHERALALGEAVDLSTKKNYGSALNSYLNFVLLHHLPIEPTDDTLSLYTVWQSHHIKPDSVDSYLSGIAHQLEPYFPDVRKARASTLVKRTLRGCKRMRNTPTVRKRALTLDDLGRVISFYSSSTCHDDLLFVCQLLSGFFALHRLGELTFPDDVSIRNWRKVIKRSSAIVHDDSYEYHLPHHKGDPFFEGNRIIIRRDQYRHDPLFHFRAYLASR
jgi:hypothetical protein